MFSEDAEVMELVTLTPDDPNVIWDESGERVLLLTWHDYADECMPGNPVPSGNGDIWAASMGEMMAWYAEHGKAVWWIQVIKIIAGVGLLLSVQAGTNAVVSQLVGNALYKTGITYFFTIAIVGSCYPMAFRLVTAKEKHEA